jgi:hypothetical protein
LLATILLSEQTHDRPDIGSDVEQRFEHVRQVLLQRHIRIVPKHVPPSKMAFRAMWRAFQALTLPTVRVPPTPADAPDG